MRESITMEASELRNKTCCFTGHRELPMHKLESIEKRTADEIRALVVDCGVRYFGVGGALGYDTLAAEILFRLRKQEFPNIKIILVYPFNGFTCQWTPCQRVEYQQRLLRYDKVVCVEKNPGREAYLARDRHLVDSSAYCIAYCTKSVGGTAYTVRYAKSRGLVIRNIGECGTQQNDVWLRGK